MMTHDDPFHPTPLKIAYNNNCNNYSQNTIATFTITIVFFIVQIKVIWIHYTFGTSCESW